MLSKLVLVGVIATSVHSPQMAGSVAIGIGHVVGWVVAGVIIVALLTLLFAGILLWTDRVARWTAKRPSGTTSYSVSFSRARRLGGDR